MLDWVKKVMDGMGHGGVVVLMFLENVFPPIPSEVVMPLAGYTAGRGDLSFWGVVAAGTAGSVLGALPLYYLGHWAGVERVAGWAERHGKWLTLRREDVERADAWFDRYGRWAVLFGRLVPGVRSLVSIPAGFAGMPLVPFLAYTAVGAGAWAALLAWLGKLFGESHGRVAKVVGPLTWVVLGALAAAFVVWVARRRRRA